MLDRLYHTLAPLPASQLGWLVIRRGQRLKDRLLAHLARRFPRSQSKAPHPSTVPLLRLRVKLTKPVDYCRSPPSRLGAFAFRFLNQTHQLQFPQAWNDPALPKLWLYNLHYMADLNEADSHERRQWQLDFIKSWIEDNPKGQGNGWEPYPTSLRIMNWIKAALDGLSLDSALLASLDQQVHYLRGKLEYDLRGNHLVENMRALLWAGWFFDTPQSKQWQEFAQKSYLSLLQQQILSDGGHYELSPMYHALILEGLLDTINLLGIYGEASLPYRRQIAAYVDPMLDWLAKLTHPDGEVSFFNDSVGGIAPTHRALVSYWHRLAKTGSLQDDAFFEQSATLVAESSWLGSASGYARLEKGAAVLIADAAALGPDEQPGHAHADSLSFELSLKGKRVLVNSGISTYQAGLDRTNQRGTAAHNCLCLDSHDSSDVWAGFRLGRRAVTHVSVFNRHEPSLSATHNGFAHRQAGALHHRTWRLGEASLMIEDEVTGEGNPLCEIYFHFHPDWQLLSDKLSPKVSKEISYVSLSHQNLDLRVTVNLGKELDWQVRPSFYHSGFGLAERNFTLYGVGRSVLPWRIRTQFLWE